MLTITNFNEFIADFTLQPVHIESDDVYTIQQAINNFGFGWFHVKMSLLVGLCWMIDSMEMTILSILAPLLYCEWKINKYQQALTTSIVFFGMMISSTFWYHLSDKYGRKSALVLCGVLMVLYSLLSSVAPTFSWLILLRALVGFCIGCIPQSVTLYAEFLPSKHKEKCVALLDCFWAFGACFEILLALLVLPKLNWRWFLGLSTSPSLMFTLLTPYLTESPQFYMLKQRNDKAEKVLKKIATNNKKHMLIGRLTMDTSVDISPTIKSIFKPSLRTTTILLWFIWMACAFCYYGLVLISAELILTRHETTITNCSEFFTTNKLIDLLWITLSEFPGILLTLLTIRRFGKRKTMALQFAGFAISLLIITINNSAIVNLSFLFVSRGIISGLFQGVYIYTPDVYPATLKSVGIYGCSALARLGAMITPFVAQALLQSSISQALLIYSIVAVTGAISCILLPKHQL